MFSHATETLTLIIKNNSKQNFTKYGVIFQHAPESLKYLFQSKFQNH